MCYLIGIGIGLFFVLIGGLFLYLNTKDDHKYLKLFSLISFEAGIVLLGVIIILVSVLPLIGIGTGTCESILD
ncbi:hypothetical protein [Paenisporosarcina sp. TG20]|uniref:hypothetical protein n=1 Tax=Paenisporosarcina sp. TG20 TaxID=1211706 RepID=UPI0002E763CC|nr:hypothetical protein [Paenisporosarcina sp. TG20]